MENMLCRECGSEMGPGKVMIPVWGCVSGKNPERGDTISPRGSFLGDCMKCPKCGHSVSNTGHVLETECKVE